MKCGHKWNNVDWTQRDCKIARQVGVTRQAVFVHRRSREIPAPPSLRRYLKSLGSETRKMTAREMHSACPVNVQLSAVLAALLQLNLKYKKYIRVYTSFDEVAGINWDLPNADIEKIWGKTENYAGNVRYRKNIGPAKWDKSFGWLIEDSEYNKAIREEKRKAKKWKKH